MNAIMHRLGTGERRWAAEVAFRGLGILLLGLCALATLWLYRSAHQPPAHDASARELFAGLVAVQGWCIGTCLVAQGPGLFKLVPDLRRRGTTISIQGNSR